MPKKLNREWVNQLNKEDAEMIAHALFAVSSAKGRALANRIVKQHKIDPKIKNPSEYYG